VWAFGDALSHATEDYYQFCHAGQLDLDPLSTRKARWIDALIANLETLLAKGRPFVICQEMEAVFGSTLGYARETHLRTALDRLHEAGRTLSDAKGPLKNKLVRPA